MPGFVRAARGLNGMVVGDNTLVIAGVALVSFQGILVFHSGCDISVVVSIIFSKLSLHFFSSLSGSGQRTHATIGGRSATKLIGRRGRGSAAL